MPPKPPKPKSAGFASTKDHATASLPTERLNVSEWADEGTERERAARPARPAPFEDEATEATEISSGHDDGSVRLAVKPPKKNDQRFEPTQRVIRQTKGARPKGSIGIKGTKGAGAMAQKLLLDRKVEENMPSTRIPVLRLVAPHMDRSRLLSLEEILLGHFDSRRDGDASSSPKRNLERLIHDQEFVALEPRIQAALLSAVVKDPNDAESSKAFGKLVSTGILGRTLPADRKLLLDLMTELPSRYRRLLAAVSERPLRKRTALEDRNVEDGSLLDSIASLAATAGYGDKVRSHPIDPRILACGMSPEDALLVILSTLAYPERMPLEDGGAGVLGMIEFALAETTPAEYARMWQRLLSGELSLDLPTRGSLDLAQRLAASKVTFSGSETPLRLALEILPGIAHPRSGPTREALVMPGGHGIDADVTAQSLALLYGVEYSVYAGARPARRALEGVGPPTQRVPPAFLSLLFEGGERLFVLERMAERVFFRGPHGTSTKPRGAVRLDPNRAVEDPNRGLESVSNEEFDGICGVALIPRS